MPVSSAKPRELLDGVEFAVVPGLGEIEALGQSVGAGGCLLAGLPAPPA
jgi:hypothetical protein